MNWTETLLINQLTWAATIALLFVPFTKSFRVVVFSVLVSWVLINLQFDTTSLHGILYGVFGDLSITSTILIAFFLARRATTTQTESVSLNEKFIVFHKHLLTMTSQVNAIVIAAVLWFYPFYAASLGSINFDPYHLGYSSLAFKAGVLTLSLLFAVTKWYLVSFTLLTCVVAFEGHLLESNNLWDYLIDPLLGLVGFVAIVVTVIRKGLKAAD